MAEWDPNEPATYIRVVDRVELQFEQAELSEAMSLRRATAWDCKAFRAGPARPSEGFLPTPGPNAGDCLAELSVLPMERNESKRTAAEAFSRLQVAIRLLKDGAADLRSELISQPNGFVSGSPLAGFLDLVPTLWGFRGRTCDLLEDDVEDLTTLFLGLKTPPKGIEVALGRFNSGCRRRDRSDRFIDWWVALESIFGERGDSLTYKISLRAAYFTASREERVDVARTLRDAYKARSDVVHGSEPKDIKKLEDAVGVALRTALRKLLTRGISLHLRNLDDFIAGGGVP